LKLEVEKGIALYVLVSFSPVGKNLFSVKNIHQVIALDGYLLPSAR
jgi:hypothetical protein